MTSTLGSIEAYEGMLPTMAATSSTDSWPSLGVDPEEVPRCGS
jgi:hypothetical protein